MYRVLKTEPDSNPSSYLCTRPCQSGSFRQFHPSWVSKHRWLHYSRHVNGAYCRACVCFGPSHICGQPLGHFVTTPFTSWIKMSKKATVHSKKEYHLFSMSKMDEFLARYVDPSLGVDMLL